MKEQNKIDKFFRENLEGRQFEYKDSYWKAAEELIDKNNGPNPNRPSAFPYWGAILLGLMAILIPTLLWFSFTGSKSTLNAENQSNKNIPSIENQIQSETSQLTEKREMGETNASGSSIIEKNAIEKIRMVKNPIGTNEVKTPVPPNDENTTLDLYKPDVESAESKLPNQPEVKSEIESLNSQLESRESIPPANVTEDIVVEDVPIAIPTETSSEPVLIDLSGASKETDEVPPPMDLDQLTAISLGDNDAPDGENSPARIASLIGLETVQGPSRSKTEAAFQNFWNSSLPKDMEGERKYAEQIKIRDKKHAIGITMGTTLSLGFSSAGSQTKVSTFPVSGLTYSYRVTPKLRLHTGVAYQARGGLIGNYRYTTREYGFGSTQSSVVITPKSLHYVEIPAFATFKVFNRHYVQAGASIAYLLNVSSNQVAQSSNGFEDKNKVWGFKQGFSNYDFQLRVGYGFYMGKGFTMNAEAALGLIDLTENTFFQNDQKDTNIQLRLRLAYDLFRF